MNQKSAASGQTTTKTRMGTPPVLVTEIQIRALTGISPFKARRQLIKCGPPIAVQFNGRPVNAWPISKLPPIIRAALADTVNHLASGAGPVSDPLPAEPAIRRNSKTRSDARLANLPDADKRRIFNWLVVENLSYAAAREKVRKTLGVEISASALSAFYQTFGAARTSPLRQLEVLAEISIGFTPDGAKVSILAPRNP
jgi:hypothetical protein